MRTSVKVNKWQGWLSFALGLWLAVSPWIVGYSDHDGATANAVFAGLGLALASHFEAALELPIEWINLAVGLWLMAAPFMLGYAAVSIAMVTSVAVGTLVAVLACSAMSLGKELGNWWHRHVAGH